MDATLDELANALAGSSLGYVPKAVRAKRAGLGKRGTGGVVGGCAAAGSGVDGSAAAGGGV